MCYFQIVRAPKKTRQYNQDHKGSCWVFHAINIKQIKSLDLAKIEKPVSNNPMKADDELLLFWCKSPSSNVWS